MTWLPVEAADPLWFGGKEKEKLMVGRIGPPTAPENYWCGTVVFGGGLHEFPSWPYISGN